MEIITEENVFKRKFSKISSIFENILQKNYYRNFTTLDVSQRGQGKQLPLLTLPLEHALALLSYIISKLMKSKIFTNILTKNKLFFKYITFTKQKIDFNANPSRHFFYLLKTVKYAHY